MKKNIVNLIEESIGVKKALIKREIGHIEKLADMMKDAIKRGNKILIFGNGGSASDSIHIAAELVGRFQKERMALPAIALSSNISSLTAIGNDYGFEYIFQRQIEALGRKGDMALGLSTSGTSKNVILGIKKAKALNLKTAVLIGDKHTELSKIADVSVCVPSTNTARVQESHITIGHIVCELIENAL